MESTQARAAVVAASRTRSLDDWYRTINRIYLDQNFYRDVGSVFGHLVEVVGGLSLLGTEKDKPGVDPLAFLPKTIAWWLALCGKMGVRSVEAMLWAKFPYSCPYCQRAPHISTPCLEQKRQHRGPNWDALVELGKSNAARRPRSLAEWQRMFHDIYPTENDPVYSKPILRFTEEMGELAESVRIRQVAPGYFLSEASDVFAWLMNVQNVVHAKKKLPDRERGLDLAVAFAAAYPDRCPDCGGPVCTCPPVLTGALGRIAHEIPRQFLDLMPAPLMTEDEARVYFELGETSVRFGSTMLDTDVDLLRGIHGVVSELRIFAVENADVAKARAGELARSLAAIEELTSSQRLTQESIDRLSEAIATLPSESRSALVGFLTGLGSSAWVSALLEVAKLTPRIY